MSKKQQHLFIQLLADLLRNGFTIQESLLFMKKSRSISETALNYLTDAMEQGDRFYSGLVYLGFKTTVITQIEFAQAHGDLSGTLDKIKDHALLTDKQHQHLLKVLSYPALLLVFLFIVLISIRQILLPQLLVNGTVQANNPGIHFIQQSPYYFIGSLLSSFFVIGTYYIHFRKKTFLEKALFFSRLPLIGRMYKQYCSAFFALEWGKLFSQGLEIKNVIRLMKTTNQRSLMYEIAEEIETKALAGTTFYDQLKTFPFFSSELALIIQQGEVKGNLGKELIVYSELCWQQFFRRVEKMIQLIQPVIFLVVALMVVGIYAAMLLPIYGGMEEYL
ncbi:competence type IV pilus assembly protein ComGB [Enterococcus wangshanyuanii]|uniref:competence type IV pilus assembly protein ComGB n=1 Tax=Enterococcus wangshanyuanii TaxID=2005703 RepID=UPI001D03CAF7|nr:competence type IV pilus assembly protein ComGB [Enterococcus wangshanyuanii]